MIVLRAIEEGLDAQILRMGNITNRYSDGVFQQNVEENAFAKRLKSFIELGIFPEYLLEHAIELGPVDVSAEAVIKILDYNSDCNVFHIYNPKLLPIKLLINTLHELGININGVDNETMTKKLTEILNDDFKKEILSGIIHDIDSKKQLIYTSNIRIGYRYRIYIVSNINTFNTSANGKYNEKKTSVAIAKCICDGFNNSACYKCRSNSTISLYNFF